jgi:hypothetical protein
MQVRSLAILVLCVCLLAGAASAQEAMRVSPTRFQPFDEAFLTIHVSGVGEFDATTVRFVGPAGTYTVEPTAWATNFIVVWVPDNVMHTQGVYTVDVFVTRATGIQHFGPAHIEVAPQPPDPTPPPEFVVPEVLYVQADSPNGAVVTFNLVSNDGSPVVCNPASGSSFALGLTTVTCSATNAFGTTTHSFPLWVLDMVAPVLHLPADITTNNPFVTFTVTATDALDPDPDVFCSPASGQNFPGGTTIVNCFAVDHHSNFAEGSFKVTVTNGTPILTVPDDMTVEATSPNGAVVTFTATATEGGVVTCTRASGSTFPLGVTTVTCTATNAIGSDTESFSINVGDTVAPVITSVTASPDSLWPPDHKMVPVTITVVSTDAVDPTPVCEIIDVASNQPVNGGGDGDTSPDWSVTGPLTVDLRAERTGTSDRIYKVWVQCVDASGNPATGKVEVRVSQSKRRSSR